MWAMDELCIVCIQTLRGFTYYHIYFRNEPSPTLAAEINRFSPITDAPPFLERKSPWVIVDIRMVRQALARSDSSRRPSKTRASHCASACNCSDDSRDLVPHFLNVHFPSFLVRLRHTKHNTGFGKAKLRECNKWEPNTLYLWDFSRNWQLKLCNLSNRETITSGRVIGDSILIRLTRFNEITWEALVAIAFFLWHWLR